MNHSTNIYYSLPKSIWIYGYIYGRQKPITVKPPLRKMEKASMSPSRLYSFTIALPLGPTREKRDVIVRYVIGTTPLEASALANSYAEEVFGRLKPIVKPLNAVHATFLPVGVRILKP